MKKEHSKKNMKKQYSKKHEKRMFKKNMQKQYSFFTCRGRGKKADQNIFWGILCGSHY